MTRTAILLGSSMLALLALGGCSSDCNLACSEASECVVIAPNPSNVDVCTHLCENAIDDEPSVSEGDVTACADCLEGASCTDVKDGDCDALCAGIPGVNVPQS